MKVVATLSLPADSPLRSLYDEDYVRERLEGEGFEFEARTCRTEEEVIEAAEESEAVLVASEPITRKVIQNLNKCRIIATVKVGLENIDVEAATERGIIVTNVPDYCTNEVAEQALMLILALNRKVFTYDRLAREEKWTFPIPGIHRLRGQTLGIIGLGRIGRTLAYKSKGLDFRIIGYDPYVHPQAVRDLGVEMMDLDSVLAQSDYVSIHMSLTKETRHMLTLEHFKKMKPSAYLINVSRGAVLVEQDLYKAVSEGYIAGAGLDVLETIEPYPPSPDNPLFKLGSEKIILTGHSGAISEEAQAEERRLPVEEIIQALKGGWPRDIALANPKVKEKLGS